MIRTTIPTAKFTETPAEKPAAISEDASAVMSSARPAMTARLMDETGLDEAMLRDLVRRFHERLRGDEILGPILAARISDWARHSERMVAFWSSVLLMTGRYHGAPVPAHARLGLDWEHFERWLTLFRATAREVCPPAGAARAITSAERIARSLHGAARRTRKRTDVAAAPR